MVADLGLGVFGAALATLIAQGVSAVFSFLIFLYRMRRYKCRYRWFDRQELQLMLRIAIPSVLQQSTVSIGMMIVQAVVNPFGTFFVVAFGLAVVDVSVVVPSGVDASGVDASGVCATVVGAAVVGATVVGTTVVGTSSLKLYVTDVASDSLPPLTDFTDIV